MDSRLIGMRMERRKGKETTRRVRKMDSGLGGMKMERRKVKETTRRVS